MNEGSPKDLSKVRGWLVLFAVALVPHTLQAIFFLTNPGLLDFVLAEPIRLVNVVSQLLGGVSGLLLITTRNRVTPAFFTLYIPFLLVLFLLDPDPAATRLGYLEGIAGAVENPELAVGGESTFALSLALSFTSAALALGYWWRSKRVKAVFGSTGLGLFRRGGGGQPGEDA